MTLTFELDLDMVRVNQCAICLVQTLSIDIDSQTDVIT